MLHLLTGRLENAPPPGDPTFPARIDAKPIPIAAAKASLQLPARSVSVLEIPLK